MYKVNYNFYNCFVAKRPQRPKCLGHMEGGRATLTPALGTKAWSPRPATCMVTEPQDFSSSYHNDPSVTHTLSHIHTYTGTHPASAYLPLLMGNSPPPQATHWLLAASFINRICAEIDLSDIGSIGPGSILCCTLSMHSSKSPSAHSWLGNLQGPGDTEMREGQPCPQVALSCKQISHWLQHTLISRPRLCKLPSWLLYCRAMRPLWASLSSSLKWDNNSSYLPSHRVAVRMK